MSEKASVFSLMFDQKLNLLFGILLSSLLSYVILYIIYIKTYIISQRDNSSLNHKHFSIYVQCSFIHPSNCFGVTFHCIETNVPSLEYK